jgi:hypothetical protein
MNNISQSDPNRQNNNELAVTSSNMVGNNIPKSSSPEKEDNLNVFGDDGLTFGDFIDIINPLHHLPVIGSIYREITDDDLGPASKVLGGSLFLGPIGSISAIVNVLISETTGKDLTEHALAIFENTNTTQPEVSTNQTSSNEKLDPVTAWAITESSYRQIASQNVKTTEKSIYRQALFKDIGTSTSQTNTVTEWAKSEASYRKVNSIAGMNRIKETKNTEDNMTSVKNNVLTDGNSPIVPTAIETKKFIHNRSKNIVAMYKRQQSIPIKNNITELLKFDNGPPAGAIATEGGWFSDTMMSALGKTKNVRKPDQ